MRSKSGEFDLDGVGSLLLLAPPLVAHEDDVCGDLLTDHTSDADVLLISLNQSVDRQLDKWRNTPNSPNRLGLISVGDSVRSAAAGQSSGPALATENLTIDTVTNPGDLTGIGVSVVKLLGYWEPSERRLITCFDSISTLLQYADMQRVYRFLHVIIGKLDQHEGMCHFHMNPDAHDTQTVNTVKTLFDAVVEQEGDEWTVHKR